MIFVQGCATGGPVNECQWVQPIYIESTDLLSDDTARQIYLHNETWLKVCK